MFCVYSVENGRCQSRRPSLSETPMMFSCDERDHLADTFDVRNDWRRVRRTIPGPGPLDVARVRVERGERTLSVTADVHDHETAIHER